MDIRTEVIFDVETQKLFNEIETNNPADLGISIVSVYRRETTNGHETEGTMHSFWEHELTSMWDVFESADRIIGFNSIRFDVPALSGYAPKHFSKLPHFDILEKVKDAFGRRLSLNALATATLGIQKTDVGTNAVYYWHSKTPENLTKLKTYCESDVLITRDLYDYGMQNGHVKYTDRLNIQQTLEVDFSYPKQDSGKQIGLF